MEVENLFKSATTNKLFQSPKSEKIDFFRSTIPLSEFPPPRLPLTAPRRIADRNSPSSSFAMSTDKNPDYELSEKVSDGEEKPLEDAEIDSDKLKDDDQVVNSVNLLSGNADEILPLLQNLLIQNDIQREKLMGLIQLYDPTAENRNAVVNAEGEQIATETVDLSTMVQFLEHIVQKLEEELENQKKTNAQLEDEINRLTKKQ